MLAAANSLCHLRCRSFSVMGRRASNPLAVSGSPTMKPMVNVWYGIDSVWMGCNL